MLDMVSTALPTAASVTDRLLDMFGPELIWQIRRLGDRTFQAWTRDGRVLIVVLRADQSLSVTEAEAVY